MMRKEVSILIIILTLLERQYFANIFTKEVTWDEPECLKKARE